MLLAPLAFRSDGHSDCDTMRFLATSAAVTTSSVGATTSVAPNVPVTVTAVHPAIPARVNKCREVSDLLSASNLMVVSGRL